MKTHTAQFLEKTLISIELKLRDRVALHEQQLFRRVLTLSKIAQRAETTAGQTIELKEKLRDLARTLKSVDRESSDIIITALEYINDEDYQKTP